jgi:hypothetical protein
MLLDDEGSEREVIPWPKDAEVTGSIIQEGAALIQGVVRPENWTGA